MRDLWHFGRNCEDPWGRVGLNGGVVCFDVCRSFRRGFRGCLGAVPWREAARRGQQAKGIVKRVTIKKEGEKVLLLLQRVTLLTMGSWFPLGRALFLRAIRRVVG